MGINRTTSVVTWYTWPHLHDSWLRCHLTPYAKPRTFHHNMCEQYASLLVPEMTQIQKWSQICGIWIPWMVFQLSICDARSGLWLVQNMLSGRSSNSRYSVAWLYVWFRSLQRMRKYHPWNLKSLEIILKNHHNTCWPYLVVHWYVVQIFVFKHRFSQKVTSGFHLCMTEAVPDHRETWNLGV